MRTMKVAGGAAAACAAAALLNASMVTLLSQQPPQPAPVPAILQRYKPVTAERLKKPEDGDWLTVRRTYDGWGYSPLEQITPGNVAKLQPVWVFATGERSGHQAPPMVNNGVMFVATPGNQVIALDAKTGAQLWRYRRPISDEVIQLHRTSRGVGLYGNKVYFAAAEAVLVALDAADRQGSLDDEGGRKPERLLHVGRAPGGGRQGDGRRIGRRARDPRVRRGVRCGHRQAGVEDVHGARAGRTRQRHLAAQAISGRPAAVRCG